MSEQFLVGHEPLPHLVPRAGEAVQAAGGDGSTQLVERQGGAEIYLMLLIDSLLDHDQQELAVNLSSALGTFRLNVTQHRKARRGDFWVEYGQLTQTASHAKDRIERRHKFFAEKMLALLNPQPEDLQTQL